jgi:hypothetical protein
MAAGRLLLMRKLSKLVAAVAAAGLVSAPPAFAQGCVLCYTSVAGGGSAAMRAFAQGVLVLLVPALLLCLGIAFLIYRRARATSLADATPAQAFRVRWMRPLRALFARSAL